MEEDDFHVQLDSSYEFNIDTVDFAKLKSIRIKKNNKKSSRVFQQMGLPVEVDRSSACKKIVQLKPKSGTTSANNSSKGESTTSTNLQNIPKEQRDSMKHYRGCANPRV